MTAEEFKAGIREVIADALVDHDYWNYDELNVTTHAVAEAVHTYIVNKLQPPS